MNIFLVQRETALKKKHQKLVNNSHRNPENATSVGSILNHEFLGKILIIQIRERIEERNVFLLILIIFTFSERLSFVDVMSGPSSQDSQRSQNKMVNEETGSASIPVSFFKNIKFDMEEKEGEPPTLKQMIPVKFFSNTAV